MSFIVYRRRKTTSGQEFSDPVLTRGIPRAIGQYVNPKLCGKTKVEWHLDTSAVLEQLGFASDDYALVTDVKPKDTKVSLYEITDFWGVSDENWTPLGVRLETLCVDRTHSDPAQFKRSFTVNDSEREIIREFLYMKVGKRGGWGWGRVGLVNGALLWPDVWAYLVISMSERR